jgi:hypothetical protein
MFYIHGILFLVNLTIILCLSVQLHMLFGVEIDHKRIHKVCMLLYMSKVTYVVVV